LSRHITLASHFLQRLDDAVPDRFVAIWLNRLSAMRQLQGETAAEGWAADPAWKATAVLLKGATQQQAHSIIHDVLRHPRWRGNDVAREPFYEVLEAAAATANKTACRGLVKAAIPHVIANPPGIDFRSALRLLMTVAERWPTLKPESRKKLYRRGRPLPHLLASAAPFFEQRVHLGATRDAVKDALAHLQLQVQHLAPGAMPSSGQGEFMLQTKQTPTGTVVAMVGSCVEELDVLIRYRKRIDRSLRRQLVQTIIKTLSDPENHNANRVNLFEALRRLCDSIDSKTAGEVAHAARRYAGDHRAKAHPLHGQPEQHAPLEPFRMGLAWPQQVRGKALLTLAEVSRHHPKLVGPKLSQMIFDAIADSDPSVRRNAYHAVYIAGPPAMPCLPGVVGGIRDSDASAANVALQVVGLEAASIVKAGLLPTVLSFLENHRRHPDVGVRSAGASVIPKIRAALRLGASEDIERLNALADRLNSDVSRSVRTALAAEPTPDGNHGPRRSHRQTKPHHQRLRGAKERTRPRERPLTIKPLVKPNA
jgi:hypothetical protein